MLISRFHRPATVLAIVPLLAACSVAPAGTDINDPYEQVNRQVHAFNKGLDAALIDPAGEAVSLLPDIVKDGIINFSDNAGLPNAAVNGLLQGDFDGAARNSLRFVLNTTVGLLGFFDPAGTLAWKRSMPISGNAGRLGRARRRLPGTAAAGPFDRT